MTAEFATPYRRASRIPAEPGKPYFIEKGEGDRVHLHPDTYEVFYVTAGAVRLFVEDTEGGQQEKLLTPGDFGFVPKNCPHAYRMERHHSMIAGVAAGPGGTFERFFENLGVPAEEMGLLKVPAVPEPHKFGVVPQRYDAVPAGAPLAHHALRRMYRGPTRHRARVVVRSTR
ncbi:cupin domain-containing protein [Amycolatopsis methanolica]|uniref:cupin domain-containing protein n=1 Tax=Amycolatopsis methanolica TaxID=1814 RepID=UPI00341FF9B8